MDGRRDRGLPHILLGANVIHEAHKFDIFYFIFTMHQAGRFRKLVGTMSPPDDSDKAEIIVEVSTPK